MKVKLEDDDMHLVINRVPDDTSGYDVFEINEEEYKKYKDVHQWLQELLDKYLMKLKEKHEPSTTAWLSLYLY